MYKITYKSIKTGRSRMTKHKCNRHEIEQLAVMTAVQNKCDVRVERYSGSYNEYTFNVDETGEIYQKGKPEEEDTEEDGS